MKLGIGTAQFGMDYGISNVRGQCSEDEIRKIIESAVTHGIQVIDTAVAYGSSEEVLGRILPQNTFDVITKISTNQTFQHSLKRLNRKKIYALLAHNADHLLDSEGEKLWKQMQKAKETDKVQKIGASVYNSNQIDQLLKKYPIDLIQVPINLLDQRLILSGHLDRLKDLQIEIHARSVFLQGLLLLKPEKLPVRFSSIQPLLKKLHQDCAQTNLTIIETALGFVQSLTQIDKVIVGFSSHNEFLDLIRAAEIKLQSINFSQYAINDNTILNPSCW
ncbi:TPA: aldo/keto reductase [Legionella pneumophila]|uniref:aldo/keto reductase n=1 Tax=Legionella pneumophila TaxID=446 RepID=UPI000485F41C|nr:aldo/keto reductase [Legionella pneumophila]BCL64357.1 hypothetical protein [Legionella pneumophila serogroup 2]MCK1858153.1 aldo/keto reductase [Legionella pneumophila]RYW93374.1 aldo/keto reductase [Legionella pneumophila]STX98253.1 putative aldo/keto reductase family protein [Legionella pneumophila]HAT1774453.1 aldo/keto reductase [Legionella pneumophila]